MEFGLKLLVQIISVGLILSFSFFTITQISNIDNAPLLESYQNLIKKEKCEIYCKNNYFKNSSLECSENRCK